MAHTGKKINIKATVVTQKYFSKEPTNVNMYLTQKVSQLAQAIRAGYAVVNPGKKDQFLNLRELDYVKEDRFLNDTKTIRNEGLNDGDLVVLTNYENKALVDTIVGMMPELDSSVSGQKKKSKWVRVIRALIRSIPWIGPAIDALFEKD